MTVEHMVYEYDEVLTVADFAEVFKLSRSAVRSLIRQKKIKAIKIGGHYRIPRKIVDSFFSQAELSYDTVLEESYGMWEEREDIEDGVEFIRKIRSK